MEVLIRLTSGDIWLGLAEKKEPISTTNYFPFSSFFPLWKWSKVTPKFSQYSILKESGGASSVSYFIFLPTLLINSWYFYITSFFFFQIRVFPLWDRKCETKSNDSVIICSFLFYHYLFLLEAETKWNRAMQKKEKKKNEFAKKEQMIHYFFFYWKLNNRHAFVFSHS